MGRMAVRMLPYFRGRGARIENEPESDVRVEAVGQKSWIYNHRHFDPRARNRGKHRDLQRGPRGTAGAAAVP